MAYASILSGEPSSVLNSVNDFLKNDITEDALEIAYRFIAMKKKTNWSHEYEKLMLINIELGIALNKQEYITENLANYRNVSQGQTNSLETVFTHYLDLLEEQLTQAKSHAGDFDKIIDEINSQDDPQLFYYNTLNTEKGKEKEKCKRLWRMIVVAYKSILDLTNRNTKLENLYVQFAEKVLQKMADAKATSDFRYFCSVLKNHQSVLQDNSKTLGNSVYKDLSMYESSKKLYDLRMNQFQLCQKMNFNQEGFQVLEDIHTLLTSCKYHGDYYIEYYQHLAEVFFKGGFYFFHALSLYQHFIYLKKSKTSKSLHGVVTRLVLASLSVNSNSEEYFLLPSMTDKYYRLIGTRKSIEDLFFEMEFIIPMFCNSEIKELFQVFIGKTDIYTFSEDIDKIFASINSEFAEYSSKIKENCILVVLKLLANFFSNIGFDELSEFTAFMSFEDVKKIILVNRFDKHLNLTLDYENKMLNFNNNGIRCSQILRRYDEYLDNLAQVRNVLLQKIRVSHESDVMAQIIAQIQVSHNSVILEQRSVEVQEDNDLENQMPVDILDTNALIVSEQTKVELQDNSGLVVVDQINIEIKDSNCLVLAKEINMDIPENYNYTVAQQRVLQIQKLYQDSSIIKKQIDNKINQEKELAKEKKVVEEKKVTGIEETIQEQRDRINKLRLNEMIDQKILEIKKEKIAKIVRAFPETQILGKKLSLFADSEINQLELDILADYEKSIKDAKIKKEVKALKQHYRDFHFYQRELFKTYYKEMLSVTEEERSVTLQTADLIAKNKNKKQEMKIAIESASGFINRFKQTLEEQQKTIYKSQCEKFRKDITERYRSFILLEAKQKYTDSVNVQEKKDKSEAQNRKMGRVGFGPQGQGAPGQTGQSGPRDQPRPTEFAKKVEVAPPTVMVRRGENFEAKKPEEGLKNAPLVLSSRGEKFNAKPEQPVIGLRDSHVPPQTIVLERGKGIMRPLDSGIKKPVESQPIPSTGLAKRGEAFNKNAPLVAKTETLQPKPTPVKQDTQPAPVLSRKKA